MRQFVTVDTCLSVYLAAASASAAAAAAVAIKMLLHTRLLSPCERLLAVAHWSDKAHNMRTEVSKLQRVATNLDTFRSTKIAFTLRPSDLCKFSFHVHLLMWSRGKQAASQ
jgi:hypothetical protein